MASTDNYFGEQIEYISAVLKMLNEANLPDSGPGGYHIRISLHDEDGLERGHFSDEIAGDAWYYQPEIFGGAA